MKLRYLVLAGAMAQAGWAHGMGLGELELQSYLGNPLQADLQVVGQGAFDQEDIRVRIARPEVYERFGARFESFHNQIDFKVLSAAGGEIRVQANSKNSVQEPFLDIVVELSWPQGTTYRRYSLLVDPPAYAARWRKSTPADRPLETAAIALAQPARSHPARSSPTHANPIRSTPARATAALPRRPEPAVAIAGPTRPYVVQSGDSLWKIAQRLQSATGVSTRDLMQQLLAANPGAFIDGNPDRLRLGVTLTVPAENTAIADNVAPSPATPVLDIQAELASAQQARLAAVPDTGEEIRAALAQLEREKAELRAFQEQVKQDMVDVLEQRIAVTQALQQEEQRQRGLEPVTSSAAPARTAASATASEMKVQETAVQETAINETAIGETTIQDTALQESTAQTAAPTPAQAAPVTLSSLLTPRAPAVSAPRLDTAAMTGQDLLQPEPALSNLLVSRSGPSLWYLAAMLPLGLLVVLLGMRSQRVHKLRQSESIKDEELYELVFGSRRDRSRADSPEQVRKALEQIREKAGHADQPVVASAGALANPDTGVSRDELKQMIDLYMLYSQYQKAQNVILIEISKRPSRADLRLYLMQVYAAMNDWKAFDDQLEVLQRMGNAQLLEEAMKLRKSGQPMQH